MPDRAPARSACSAAPAWHVRDRLALVLGDDAPALKAEGLHAFEDSQAENAMARMQDCPFQTVHESKIGPAGHLERRSGMAGLASKVSLPFERDFSSRLGTWDGGTPPVPEFATLPGAFSQKSLLANGVQNDRLASDLMNSCKFFGLVSCQRQKRTLLMPALAQQTA